MTTSGSTVYNPVLNEVINRAMRMVGGYSSGNTPRPEQQQDALSILNMMLKAWQADGFQWLKSIFVLPLDGGVYHYYLGPDGTAQYWPELETTINRPTRIWNLRRLNLSGYEVPIEMVSRSDYMMLPNKLSIGTVVQAYYDPQLVNGQLFVWPRPGDGVTDKIIGDCDRTLQDMVSDTDTFDLPQEWSDALSFCLAERLWWEYPDNAASYQMLAQRASQGKEVVLNYDRENVSITIGMYRR